MVATGLIDQAEFLAIALISCIGPFRPWRAEFISSGLDKSLNPACMTAPAVTSSAFEK